MYSLLVIFLFLSPSLSEQLQAELDFIRESGSKKHLSKPSSNTPKDLVADKILEELEKEEEKLSSSKKETKLSSNKLRSR